MPEGTFRHDDHKFEWTRQEFQDWSNNICARYPDYCVQFHGVGKIEGQENIGSCSQVGIFIRKDLLESLDQEISECTEETEKNDDQNNETENNDAQVSDSQKSQGYQLVHSVAYPFFRDTRTRHEKILEECKYHVNRFQWIDFYFNYESDRIEIPFKHIIDACWEITDDFEEIQPIIVNNFQTEKDLVIFPPNESDREDE